MTPLGAGGAAGPSGRSSFLPQQSSGLDVGTHGVPGGQGAASALGWGGTQLLSCPGPVGHAGQRGLAADSWHFQGGLELGEVKEAGTEPATPPSCPGLCADVQRFPGL